MVDYIVRHCWQVLLWGALLMPAMGVAHGDTALEQAQRVVPKGSGWKSFRLSDDVQLLRCLLDDKKTHLYCGMCKVNGTYRLVMPHLIAARHDQFAKFSLKGSEILAYHANGVLLARLPMWDFPPALFAPAEQIVQLRLTGTGDNLLYCEAINLSPAPVCLRPGHISIITTEGEQVTCSNLSVKLREETMLQPHATARLQLDIISKKITNPKGLTKAERVDLVYHAQESADIRHPQAIAPAVILQPGMPEMGDNGRRFPIRLRDDLAVIQCYNMGGYANMKELDFYRLHKGVWQYVRTKTINSSYTPAIFQCEGKHIRIYDISGSKLADLQLP